MDHGRIIEQGSHATLMTNRNLYYSLYESQFTEATA
jgi:ABC-type multidrug transport system fused ATPase/permease subunit